MTLYRSHSKWEGFLHKLKFYNVDDKKIEPFNPEAVSYKINFVTLCDDGSSPLIPTT